MQLSVFPGFLTTCLAVVQNPDVPFEGERGLANARVLWAGAARLCVPPHRCRRAARPARACCAGKLAGALALKRAILANWVVLRATGGPSPYPEEEKKAIRDALFAATASHPEQSILNAFADIGQHIFRHDFPDRWWVGMAIVGGHGEGWAGWTPRMVACRHVAAGWRTSHYAWLVSDPACRCRWARAAGLTCLPCCWLR